MSNILLIFFRNKDFSPKSFLFAQSLSYNRETWDVFTLSPHTFFFFLQHLKSISQITVTTGMEKFLVREFKYENTK